MTGEENPRSTHPGDSGGLCAKTAEAPSREARLSSHGPSPRGPIATTAGLLAGGDGER